MAPEHVEGRPLDFRTDVFAVGIVLYQLTVGKLPFEGKNPHEVLKRIAECKFVDPRIANPRIGNRLGRIILRAMAAMPDDRYPAIGEMVLALEAYLEESGIESDKLTSELARYFKAPGPYEHALQERLIDHLTRRGQKLLGDGEQAPALDVFDRILTIDPKNEKVLAILDGLNRRARLKTAAVALLAVGAISAGGYAIHKKNQRPPPEPPQDPTVEHNPMITLPITTIAHVESPPLLEPDIDAGVTVAVINDGSSGVVRPNNPDVRPLPDAGVEAVATNLLRIYVLPPMGSQVKFGDKPWAVVTPEDGWVERPIDGPTKVQVRNACCVEDDKVFLPGAKPFTFDLVPLAAKILPKCDAPGPDHWVRINNTRAELGEEFTLSVEPGSTQFTRTFKVEFGGDNVDGTPISVTVRAGERKVVTCRER
jgi:serine/threonine-protein kinase